LFSAACSVCYSAAATQDSAKLVSSQLREIDYTVGDIAQQTLTIDTPLGYRLNSSSLPKTNAEQVIAIRSIASSFADKAQHTRHTIVIDWQVFMALREIRAIPLLSLDLQFVKDKQLLPLHINASEVIISPLLPTKMSPNYLVPQADIIPQAISLTPYWLALLLSSAVLALLVLYWSWYWGWINLDFNKRSPFRLAWQQIRVLRDKGNTVSAMLVLSRAFDQYMQYALSHENLPRSLQQHRELAPLQLLINEFYQDMQNSFFAGQTPQMSFKQIETLARKLSQHAV
jgi:hypothetical protein